jgi:hypothetical protein
MPSGHRRCRPAKVHADKASSGRFYALAMLACAVICFNALKPPP